MERRLLHLTADGATVRSAADLRTGNGQRGPPDAVGVSAKPRARLAERWGRVGPRNVGSLRGLSPGLPGTGPDSRGGERAPQRSLHRRGAEEVANRGKMKAEAEPGGPTG